MDKGFFNFDDRLPVESLMLNTSSSTYGSSNAFSILKFGFISSRHSALGTPTMCTVATRSNTSACMPHTTCARAAAAPRSPASLCVPEPS